ncbi:MAG: SOS response-associated peptidase [Candidatus Tectimicrobiota bacterium]
MCGRFTLTTATNALAERFQIVLPDEPPAPSYNIAPGQNVLSVIQDGPRKRAEYLRWGLVPSWAKDPSIGARMINARAESVAEKPSFRQALQRRRCLVLADGFFEWCKRGTEKVPMYMRLCTHQPFAFAGLWDVWRDSQGVPLVTCTVLTTAANALVAPIHHRMPVILRPEDENVWLDPELHEPARLLSLLVSCDAETMVAYEVSRVVNTGRVNTPACILPVH